MPSMTLIKGLGLSNTQSVHSGPSSLSFPLCPPLLCWRWRAWAEETAPHPSAPCDSTFLHPSGPCGTLTCCCLWQPRTAELLALFGLLRTHRCEISPELKPVICRETKGFGPTCKWIVMWFATVWMQNWLRKQNRAEQVCRNAKNVFF